MLSLGLKKSLDITMTVVLQRATVYKRYTVVALKFHGWGAIREKKMSEKVP